MPAKSKLYTRSGDAGTTALFGRGRVAKDSARVEAYGTVDELNSTLGVAVAFCQQAERSRRRCGGVQNELFNIGSELASGTRGRRRRRGSMFTDEEAKIAALERLIDRVRREGGAAADVHPAVRVAGGAMLHLCRTVCRRAERAVVRLSHEEPVNPAVSERT